MCTVYNDREATGWESEDADYIAFAVRESKEMNDRALLPLGV